MLICRDTYKSYVGVTNNLKRRMHTHPRSTYTIGNAIRKHGLNTFILLLLAKVKREIREEADEVAYGQLEPFYINFYDTLQPNGYNESKGGKGCIVSKRSRKKQSESIKRNYKEHPEVIQRIKAAVIKRFEDPAEREKQSIRLKRYYEKNPTAHTRVSMQQRGEKSSRSKLKEEEVKIIFHAVHDGYWTTKDIAKAFGITIMTVGDIARKINWKHLWD